MICAEQQVEAACAVCGQSLVVVEWLAPPGEPVRQYRGCPRHGVDAPVQYIPVKGERYDRAVG